MRKYTTLEKEKEKKKTKSLYHADRHPYVRTRARETKREDDENKKGIHLNSTLNRTNNHKPPFFMAGKKANPYETAQHHHLCVWL